MRWISKSLGIVMLGGLLAGTATPAMAAIRNSSSRAIVRTRVVAAPRVAVRSRVIIAPPVYYGQRWYGYYEPGWYYPYGPAYYAVRPATGDVKIDTHMKDVSVYVDGGYVGPISKFKKFSLKPGNHDIELRDASGRGIFNQRVQVIVNRAVEIRPPA